jgi:HAE1 family hydrophobic/amphiphilic exporter-1
VYGYPTSNLHLFPMIRFFTEHPTAANLLMILFVVMGLLSIPNLRRETFPDITPAEVEIRVIYPGATAEDVEETICQRIEDSLDGISFMKELRSDAREGVAATIAEMLPGGNFQTFLTDIQTEVDAIDDFPTIAQEPIITQLGTTDPVLTLVVSGPLDPPDLKAYCEDLKDRLQQVPEISLVQIGGFSDHQFRVELSAVALMRFHLSAADIAQIIQRQSVNLPAGLVEARHQEILIRFAEQRRSPRELEDLIIVAQPGGGEIRLGQIAQVHDLFEIEEEKALLGDVSSDYQRAGLLKIKKTKLQDTIRVANVIKQFVRDELARRPQLDIRITEDTSILVNDRLQMLLRNGLQGVILVFFTLWLFFNLRLSFWVAMSLPISFCGAFYLLPHVDLTINMLTMVGLLLALGLLMDDGIVIAENIVSHLQQGKPAMQAAIDGTNEVKLGVFSSFLTTICVLGPLISLQGDIGKVLRVVPMILILVLGVSLVEAFLILPAHLGHSLKPIDQRRPNLFRRRFDRFIEWLRNDLLTPAVGNVLNWRYLFIGCVMGLFLVSVGMLRGGVLKFQAFPELDGDVVMARLLLPPGTPLARTEVTIEQITSALEQVNEHFRPHQPQQQDLVRSVVVEFNKNTDAFEIGPHVATVSVELLSAEVRDARIDDIIQIWRKETGPLADLVSLLFTEPALGPAGRPIEIRVRGNDLMQLSTAADEIKTWLGQFPGVYNLVSDLRPGKPELRLRLREGAYGMGLDAAAMSQQLRAAFQGILADEIQVGSESYEIEVQLQPNDQNTLADLEYFHFTLPSGEQVPLSTMTIIEEGMGWSRIARVDGRRTVTVRGELDTRLANTVNLLARMRKEFVPDLKQRYPGVTLMFEGEIKEAGTTQQSMVRSLLVGLIGVFVLLSFQFRSYFEPFTVMMAIPLALIGVIWGHLLFGIDLSMPSTLGFVSLSGIVVNDSLLLVLFLKKRRQEGCEVLEACRQASRLRFRAIMLTSLTTIAGLLPLLAEKSLQAQILIPLAVSIASGLLASTVLVLFVVPCLYAILDDFGFTAH